MEAGVCATIVVHRPDLGLLGRAVAAIAPQVDELVLFDNGGDGALEPALRELARAHRCTLLRSPANVGLAAGFNRGIAHAREVGHGFVLLLDQDSVPAPDMVAVLQRACTTLSASARVGAVGPRFKDPRCRLPAPFVRIGFPFNQKMTGAAGEHVDCDFLISSGCLIPMRVLDEVGDMDESLFIDNVDLDWSFRARHAGFRLFGICDAGMQHSIGDRVLPSRWRAAGVLVHGPTRLYYMMRNRVLLYRRAHVPRIWVAQDIPRLCGKFLRMSTIPPRLRNSSAMLEGLRDGLSGRSGPRGGGAA